VRHSVGMEVSFLGAHRVFRGHRRVPRSGLEVDAAGHGGVGCGGGLTQADHGRTGGAESFHQTVGEFSAFREEIGFDALIPAVRAHVFEVEEVRGGTVAQHARRAGVLRIRRAGIHARHHRQARPQWSALPGRRPP